MAENVVDPTLERMTNHVHLIVGSLHNNELIELTSILNNPSPTSESLIRAEKLAKSFLDSNQLDELSNSPGFKDIPIGPLINCIEVYRRDKKGIDVFLRFITSVISVYTKDENYLLTQPVSERLLLLAKEIYSKSGNNECRTELYLLSSICFIREPSVATQNELAYSLLPLYTQLLYSYTQLSTQILCLILTAFSEFITRLPRLFTEAGGFESIPFFLIVLKDNLSKRSVCLASLVLFRNAFTHNEALKQNGDLSSLPNDCLAILKAYPRDIYITRDVFAVLSDFLPARIEITGELIKVDDPLSAYCISTLRDEQCSVDIHFNVCQYFGVILPSFSLLEETSLIARLVLECVIRAKNENRDLTPSMLAAISSIVLCFPVDKLSKDTMDSTIPLTLSSSECQHLLGVILSHTLDYDTLLPSLYILKDLVLLSGTMLCTTELWTGLRHALMHFNKTSVNEAYPIILHIIYKIKLSTTKRAIALVDSGIAGSLVECFFTETVLIQQGQLISILTNVINCYTHLLEDTKPLNNPLFHEKLISLLFQQVPASKQEILHETVADCFTHLTYDESSCISMRENGILEKIIEFITSPDLQTTSNTTEAIINGFVNMAADSRVENTMIELGVHKFLIDLIRRISTQPNPYWDEYETCIHCLYMLRTRDEIAEIIIHSDTVDCITNILCMNTATEDATCNSLCLLACLENSGKHKLFTNQLFEWVSSQMKKMDNARVFACGCYFFHIMSLDDLDVRYIGGLQLDKVILTAINQGFVKADEKNLKRYFNCLHQFVCHIIPRPLSLPTAEMPLPNTMDNFIVHRHFCTSKNSCSNCEANGPRSELIMRPDSISLEQYQLLVNNGWYRRGGVKMFRFNYQHKRVCFDWETRVRVKEFDANKSKTFKRVLRKVPKGVLMETVPARFTQEGLALYNGYNQGKHGKDPKSPEGYINHAVRSPLRIESRDGVSYGTYHQEYRLNGKLIAIGVIDVIPEGIVSIYFYYDMSKEISKLSLGVYSSLKEIEFVQSLNAINPNIKYYYIQGWNGVNHKLSYKADYKPIEFCCPCISPYWTESIDIPFISTGFLPTLPEGMIPPELTNVDSTQPDLLLDSEYAYKTISIDRAYLSEVYQLALKGTDVRVCLNGEIMTCGELVERYSVCADTRQYICESLEELALAIGYPLCNRLLVVFRFSEDLPDMERDFASVV